MLREPAGQLIRSLLVQGVSELGKHLPWGRKESWQTWPRNTALVIRGVHRAEAVTQPRPWTLTEAKGKDGSCKWSKLHWKLRVSMWAAQMWCFISIISVKTLRFPFCHRPQSPGLSGIPRHVWWFRFETTEHDSAGREAVIWDDLIIGLPGGSTQVSDTGLPGTMRIVTYNDVLFWDIHLLIVFSSNEIF